MKESEIVKRLDFVIATANSGISKKIRGDYGSDYLNQADYLGFKSSALSLISSLYSVEHSYYTLFKGSITDSYEGTVKSGISILEQIKHEVQNGWLTSIKSIVTAEVFSDFLEMSKHLLDEKYKDPAAVMIGSVLEEHLRQLCASYNVEVTRIAGSDTVAKKADTLNADLAKAGAYGILEQKSVTFWLDIRNKAAHGKYSEYVISQVELMYQGVLDFISRVK